MDPEPLDVPHALGRFRVDGGKLRIERVEHYSSAEEAKAAFGPVLSAWEIDADLRASVPGTIRFRFEASEINDGNPPPPGSSAALTLKLRGQVGVACAGGIVAKRLLKSYPPLPQAFSTSSEVEIAFNRWLRFHNGFEPLEGMAYFLLTIFESPSTATQSSPRKQTAKRAAAAIRYAIEQEILDKLGELSSARFDAKTGRNFNAGKPPLTDAERAWLETVVPKLIARLGEHAAEVPLTPITRNESPLP